NLDTIRSVALSPDGTRALSGAEDAHVQLWDTATGEEVQRFGGRGGKIYSVTFSPDGRFGLSGGGDGIIRLWQLPE
ncbi:MAG TPA: hypothetical protein VFS96_08935, partial [Nitrolancea sp.]|nr:hypothetical protein [Nitrolancea sp.]